MILLFSFIYITLSVILSVLGVQRQEEILKLFLISFLLTPLIGIGYLLFRKKNLTRVHFYYCHECDYIFPAKMKHCPICEEKGKKVKLIPYHSPYRISDKITMITF